MKKLYMLLLIALSSAVTHTHAQISAYTFTAISGTYTDITNSTPILSLSNDAVTSSPIPIGFEFNFNGITYTQVVAVSDGYLSFNASATSIPINNLATSATTLRPLLAPLWDDLSSSAFDPNSGRFSYTTSGIAGSRIFTAEWKKWVNRNNNSVAVSFQVKLYEGTNKIEFIYSPQPGTFNSGSASIGIAGGSTGAGNFLSLSDAGAAPSASSTTETTIIANRPIAGQIYLFTPPPPPAIDLNIFSINNISGICPGTAVPVSIVIKNAGTNSIDFSGSNAVVTMNITGPAAQNLSATISSGILAPGATQTVAMSPNFNFSANGTYNFTSSVTVAGDGNTSNDTVVSATTLSFAPAPWAEPFATNTLPGGWGNTGWFVGSFVPGNPGNCIVKDFFSDSAIGIFNTLSVGPVTASSNLSFDYKVANVNSPTTAPAAGWGNYKLQISTDCGNTFTTIDSVTAATVSWINKSYSLAAYAGQYVQVRIVPKWRAGYYNIAFDNFKIAAPPAIDLAATGINVNAITCFNASVPVSITIKNNGTAPVDFVANNAMVTVSVTGPTTQTLAATISSGTLAPGASRVVNVSPDANLYASGTYNFKSYVIIAGDGNPLNDTLNTTTTVAASSSIPWLETFATSTTIPTGWTTNSWIIGSAAGVTVNSNNAIYKGFNSNGSNETFTTLAVGPVSTNNRLSFDYKLSGFSNPYAAPAAGWGNFKLQISTNCGGSFTTIDSVTDVSAGWVYKTYPLSAYAGQYVTLRIVTTCLSSGFIIAFDNFRMEVPPAIDLLSTGITVMPAACANTSLPVSVTIKNNGTDIIDFAASNAAVTLNITGPVAQTFLAVVSSGTLAPGGSQIVNLSPTANLPTIGTYSFKAFVTISGDGNHLNDTANTAAVITTNLYPAPWSEPFAATTTPPGWTTSGWLIGTNTVIASNGGNYLYKYLTNNSLPATFTTAFVGPVPANNSLTFDCQVASIFSPYNAPAGWGNFIVQLTTNCGTTYTTIDSITDIRNGWVNKSYSLSAYAGQYISIRIVATRLTGNYYIAFDNFKIGQSPVIDLAVTGVTVNTGTCPNADAPVAVTIKNSGSNTIDFAGNNAVVTVNISGPASQTLSAIVNSGTLAPGASRIIDVAPNANLSAGGTYNFKSSVTIPGDGYTGNDTVTLSKLFTQATSPWSEPFSTTSPPPGWSVNGWSIGAERGVRGHPGNAIYKNLYAGATTGTFTTLPVGLIYGSEKLTLEYRVTNITTMSDFYEAPAPGWGNFVVQISTDCGLSFVTIDSITTANNFWLSKSYSLAAYAGQTITTRIVANWASGNYDLAFLNFNIKNPLFTDLATTSINFNPGSCPNPSVPVSVTIKNNGANAVNFSAVNATVTLFVTLGNYYSQLLYKNITAGILAPDDTLTVFLSPNANFPYGGDYKLQSNISFSGDGNYYNDNIAAYPTIAYTTAVPWAEAFTSFEPMGWNINGWTNGSARGATGNPGINLYKHLNSDTTSGTFTTITAGPLPASNGLSFNYKLSNYTTPYGPPAAGWGYFKVQVSTNCGSSFVTIDSVNTAGSGWATKLYSLYAYAGQKVTTRIIAVWASGNYDLAFDNFEIKTLTCAVPTSAQIDSITNTTARVSFISPGSNFIIEYGSFNFSPGAGASPGSGGTIITATGSPVTITGLTPLTGYKIYVRQNCTGLGVGYSNNVLVDSFFTNGPPPPNDLPAGAISLIVGAGCSGSSYSNSGATLSVNEPRISCVGSQTIGKTVWFKFVAPPSGFVRVSTDGPANTLSDTKTALFSATDSTNYNTFQIISCDDDNGFINNTASILYATNLIPGQRYYIAVDDYDGTISGNFCLQVDEVSNSMMAATGSCTPGQRSSDISFNYKGWLSLTNDSGQLIANVRSNLTSSSGFYYTPYLNVHTGGVRQVATGEYYLNRNFRIADTMAGNYDVQFFLLNTELAALQAVAPGINVANLNVTKVKGELTCNPNFVSGGTGNDTLLVQTTSGMASNISWVTINTNGFSNFYLHPGVMPLPRVYTFTGNGNWSTPANWSNNTVPPAMLPPNCIIEINPAPGGQCLLDVTQHISIYGKFRVKSGTNIVIPGSVIVQ